MRQFWNIWKWTGTASRKALVGIVRAGLIAIATGFVLTVVARKAGPLIYNNYLRPDLFHLIERANKPIQDSLGIIKDEVRDNTSHLKKIDGRLDYEFKVAEQERRAIIETSTEKNDIILELYNIQKRDPPIPYMRSIEAPQFSTKKKIEEGNP